MINLEQRITAFNLFNTQHSTPHLFSNKGSSTVSNQLNTIAYKELRASKRGQELTKKANARAASFLFDLDSGSINCEVKGVLTPNSIYESVLASSSLTFEADGVTYTLEPAYDVNEYTALAILEDTQAEIENNLVNSELENQGHPFEYLPGAASYKTLDINMTNIVDDYEVPTEAPEWRWVEKHASFEHKDNNIVGGVWEFLLNISEELPPNVPTKLESLLKEAKEKGFSYILFHQG